MLHFIHTKGLLVILSLCFIILPSQDAFAQKKKKKKKKNKKQEQSPQSNDQLPIKEREQIDGAYVEACTQMIRGNYQEAIAEFEEVLKLDVDNHAAMYNISKISYEIRDYGKAIQYGERALKLDAENYWYYITLRDAYDDKGDISRAVELQEEIVDRFEETSAEEIDIVEEKIHLANLYARSRNQPKAIELLQAMEQQYGANEEILFKQYVFHQELNQQEESINISNRLIQLEPDNPRYYQYKYQALMQLDRTADAIETLKASIQYNPDDAYALLTLADYYKSLDDVETSDAFLFQVFQNPSVDVQGKLGVVEELIAMSYQSEAAKSRAKKLSKIILETHPDDPSAYSLKADFFLLNDQADSARVYYRQFLEEDPTNDRAWLSLLKASYQLKDYKALTTDAEEALTFFPTDSDFLFMLGVGRSHQGQYDAARSPLEKIQRLGTADPSLLTQCSIQLGGIYHKMGEYEKSDQNFQAALEREADNPLALNNYAYYLAQREEQLEKAAEMIQKALKLDPQKASYMDTYAYVLLKQASYQEAKTWIEKVIDKPDAGAEAYEHYGDILNKLGQKEEAMKQWQKALDLGAKGWSIQDKTKQP